MQENERQILHAAMPDPERLEPLISWMDAEPDAFTTLATEVDASPYSLGTWLDTLDITQRWLARKGLRAGFPDVLGYLSCCAALAGGGSGLCLDMAGTTLETLELYGMERAQPVS